MRYLGNKTRLLQSIRRVLRSRGIAPGGRAVDPFSGTATVGRALKRWQFRVEASDIMHYGYIFARAYVEVVEPPRFDELPQAQGRGLAGALAYLNALPPRPGFIHEHFSPEGGTHGRMYFTPQNAARIDASRDTVEEWWRGGLIGVDAYHVLLASIIEAADRVANTTGMYASFVKRWQPNALRSLQLRRERHVMGNGCHAAQRDAQAAVDAAGQFDLLYLDPPYNSRQYAAYYHIPELLATGRYYHGPVPMRGKAGLIEDRALRTRWCSFRHSETAFERLVATANCRHIVMSYNAEGIIPERTIERVLRTYGLRGTYRCYPYRVRRYRSDHDRADRTYRSNVACENLYCVSRG